MAHAVKSADDRKAGDIQKACVYDIIFLTETWILYETLYLKTSA